MRHSHYIVFGAGTKPNKVLVLGKATKGPGKWAISICEARNDGKYTYGDEVKAEDVEGIYTTLYFCKKESVEVMINALRLIEEGWEKK